MRVYVEMILVSVSLLFRKERTMFTIDVEFGVVEPAAWFQEESLLS